MKAAVALLVCEGARGTGYLVRPDCVLTCYHVVRLAVPDGCVQILFPHGEFLGRVVLVDITNDCAVVRLEQPVLAARPLRLSPEPAQKGQFWECYGFPAATAESGLLIAGEVQDGDGTNLRGEAAVVLHSRNVTAGAMMQGFSGSPVLVDGLVVGQLQQIVPDDKSGAQLGVVFATPVRALVALLPGEVRSGASPYRGLAAFQHEDAALFFGREALIARLWDCYHAACAERKGPRMLTILGPSGAGKSSLARAGLLPELQRRPVPGPLPPRFITLKPGEQPIETLTRALLRDFGSVPAAVLDIQGHRRLRQALRQPDERGCYDGLRLYADSLPQAAERPLTLLVDQLEELYTLCKDSEERDAFVGLLLDAVSAPGSRIMVLLTLRSDYLGEVQRYHPRLSQALAARAVVLPAMSAEELRRAISEPAARAGWPIDDGTIELLLSQAQGSAATLPLLEFALACIWDGMAKGKTAALTLKEIGGVGGALAARAQELFVGLDADAQRIARRSFLRLGYLNDNTRYVRKRRLVSELCGRGESEVQVLDVLRQFAREQVRLISLSSDPETGSTVAEVTHEALFEHWALCRGWLEEHREEQRFHNRVSEAAQWWAQANRPAGRLWRPPDLDLLRDFHRRRGDDMTQGELDFFHGSEEHHDAERAAKDAAERRLVAMYEQMRQQVLSSYVEHGRQALLNNQVHHAALWLHRAYQEGSQAPMLPFLLAQATRPLDAVTAVLGAHPDRVMGLAFHPDGTELVTACRDGVLRHWAVADGRLRRELRHASALRSVAYSSDGASVLTANPVSEPRIWNALTGEPQVVLAGCPSRTIMAVFSPGSRYVAAAGEAQSAWIWTAHDGKLFAELRGHADLIKFLAFAPDSRFLITASDDHTARIWEVATARTMHAPLVHPGPVGEAGFSPDGSLVATAASDMIVRVWSAATARLLFSLKGHSGGVTALRWSPEGELLLTVSHDHSARLWQARTGKLLAELRGHTASVVAADFSVDGRYLVTGSWDGTARIWTARTGHLVSVLRGHAGPVVAVAVSPDARYVGTASDDRTARLWSIREANPVLHQWQFGAPLAAARFSPNGAHLVAASLNGIAAVLDRRSGHLRAHLEGHGAALMDIDCSPDGMRVATASRDRTAVLWLADKGRRLADLRGHSHWVNAVSFSPDGAYLATASKDRQVCLWAADSGQRVATLRGHTATVTRVAFSPSGTSLATASYDCSVRVWAVPSGAPLATFTGHEQVINDVCFHSAGSLVASASDDSTARIWEVTQPGGGAVLHVLSGHAGGLTCVHFSPTGELVATGSRDDSARVWDVRSGKLLAELHGHTGYVSTVAFSPDGMRVATASRDGTARIWEARTGRVLAVLVGHEELVRSAVFSPDGDTLLTSGSDRSVRLWRCHPEKRSAEELAALLRCRVPYVWQDEVIVPAPLSAAAAPPALPPQSELLVEDGVRLQRLAVVAWISGNAGVARRRLAEARSHFLALMDLGSACAVIWSQAALAEAQHETTAADALYAEATALLHRVHVEPAARATAFIECARIAHDHLLLPRAALRALNSALQYTSEPPRVLTYRVESLLGSGQAEAAIKEAESLLESGQLHIGWRSIVTCLAWVAARVLGDRKREDFWGQRSITEFQASFQVGDVGWSFYSLRCVLARLPRQPRLEAALELLDALECGWNAETAQQLAGLLRSSATGSTGGGAS